VRGPDAWGGPGGRVAGFGFDAAHREWCSGFRLAARTDLGARPGRPGGRVPAAADERAGAAGPRAGPAPAGLLLDRGVLGAARAAAPRARGSRVVPTPGRLDRRPLPLAVRRPGARRRHRVEPTSGELPAGLGLARHRAKTVWGLLARAAATIPAHTLLRLGLT
jgi:hypothetical protein